MEQAQTKSLASLQPFIYEATTVKSPTPRFLKELIIRATSASGTYIFTELLQTSAIQSLKSAEPEFSAYLTILELFSWGTYQEYKATPNLPSLTDIQSEKLRQLSLLTVASPFAPLEAERNDPLTYESLRTALDLQSNQQLEALVTSAIYAGLITARLSPTSSPPRVHITSVAPLRDLRPQSLPAILQILQTWESRCNLVVSDLETQIATIQNTAAQRTALHKTRQDVVDAAVVAGENDNSRAVRARTRQGNKRDLDERLEGEDDEDVSSDEMKDIIDDSGDFGLGRGGPSGIRGAKRNRGRGGSS